MKQMTAYVPIRRAKDDGHEFFLAAEVRCLPQLVHEDTEKLRQSSNDPRAWFHTNPVRRIARVNITVEDKE